MYTINDFFDLHKDSSEWLAVLTSSPEFKQAKNLISQELKGIQVPASFYELMILKLSEALDLEIGDLLVSGWRKQREIAQYRNKENPPGGSHTVPLLEHTLVSKHSPTIQPVINEVPLAKLKFDITLKLKIKGAILVIRDGKIMQVLAGSCSGSGSIEYAGFTLLEKKTDSLDLPGSLTFKEGVPI